MTIEYSVVTVNAAVTVPLDAASFSVLDEDTEIGDPAEPGGGAGGLFRRPRPRREARL